jgi:hypothetical protein
VEFANIEMGQAQNTHCGARGSAARVQVDGV